MQQTNFGDIELSLYAKLVFHLIAVFHLDRLYLTNTIKLLWSLGFIERYKITNYGAMFKQTPKGRMYFRVKRKSFVRFAIPTIISIIALLAAYDVLWIKPLAELLQELGKLLKNIMENLYTFRKTVF